MIRAELSHVTLLEIAPHLHAPEDAREWWGDDAVEDALRDWECRVGERATCACVLAVPGAPIGIVAAHGDRVVYVGVAEPRATLEAAPF